MDAIKKVIKLLFYFLSNKFNSIRSINLRTKEFTILSNDCSGGFVYQYFGITYNTPTVGLFLVSTDYLKLAKNLKYYIGKELEFINPLNCRNYEIVKNTDLFGKYPVAKLGDIEIFFMHYKTSIEAAEKWYRRAKRINYNNLILLLTENNYFNQAILEEFSSISITHKFCLTYSKHNSDFDFIYFCEELSKEKVKIWSRKLVGRTIHWTKVINDSYNP